MRFPQPPPNFQALLAETGTRLPVILQGASQSREQQRYLHWDQLRFRATPEALSHREWWLSEKLTRLVGRKFVPLQDGKGNKFSFIVPDFIGELLHQIDREGGTLVKLPGAVTDAAERDRYVIRSLMEEAITSSQLEGAAVTREVAKKMLAEGRPAKDRGEQMILNNFTTMKRIIELRFQPLSPDLVLDIHRELGVNALDVADAAGRFRRSDELIDVSDYEGRVFHTPPSAESLPDRMAAMCAFANAQHEKQFIHPVLRAIILHFWLAFDHPFADGNGRTARALFYWSMLHSGYWLFEFVSISQFLKKAPVAYGEAFLHTETDDNDLTYFIIHQAGVIRKALLEVHEYVCRKTREAGKARALLKGSVGLNHRQQALLTHALQHVGHTYTIEEHRSLQGVAYATARADLLTLVERGWFEQDKQGKTMIFRALPDLEQHMQR
jgi:Fic family protein